MSPAVSAADAQQVVLGLAAGLGVASIYPAGHPRIDAAAERIVRELGKLRVAHPETSEITLLCVDDDLMVEGRPLPHLDLQLRPLLRVLRRHRVQRITLTIELTLADVRGFLEALVDRAELVSTQRLVLGRLLLGDAEEGDAGAGEEVLPLAERDLDMAETAFASFAGGGADGVEQLDRIVWRFMDGLAQTSRSLLLLAPLKDRSQAAFVHAMNVGLLTMAQGRALGIEGAVLHDLGVAGMLHDIGLSRLPARGAGAPDSAWEMTRRHPEVGAAMLAGADGVPPVAVQVAYEHHLRWDGGPSYPESARGRMPSFATQIVAVADTYDTMVASRTLGSAEARGVAMQIWRERSGTWLDPLLVSSFVLLVSESADNAQRAER